MPLGAGFANGNFGISQKRVHRLLPLPAFFHMLRHKHAGAGVVDRWQPPDWKPPPRSLDELPTTTIPGPLGKGMISGLCIARTGLKDKKGRVLNEVGLFLGQGRDDVARGDFLCMVKGVQVYGESLDDTHAMKISDTSFDEATRTSAGTTRRVAGSAERGAQRLRNRTKSRTRRI